MIQQQKQRLIFIFTILISGFLLLWINTYLIQIKNYSFFSELGQQQYGVSLQKQPHRGIIYDRHAHPLALNQDIPSAFITPSHLKEKDKTVAFLQTHFPKVYEKYIQNPHTHFLFIKRRLSTNEYDYMKKHGTQDIYFLQEPCRYYPAPETASVVGCTSIDMQGTSGIEFIFNTALAGTPSLIQLQKDARLGSYYFEKTVIQEGVPGTPITLTIDQELTFIARNELKKTVEEWGAEEAQAIIMNPTNGDILALVSYPDFDPNNISDLDLELTKNKNITEVYELGSVMKIFFALAALEEKIVEPDELIDCENKKEGYLYGIKLSTWKAHGILPFRDVVSFSNNFGTSKVAYRMGPELYEHYKRCGFGKKTGIPLPAEQSGFINPPERWTKQSRFSLSFGYELSATRLQLANAFCMLANNGCPIQPRLIKTDLEHKPGQPLYSQETMTIINDIMSRVITDGTAHQAKIPGFTVRGKTGTANLIDPITKKYDRNHNIFTFAGIVEKENYKRVVVTFVKGSRKKNVYSSAVAVPPFKRIAQRMVIHEKVL